MSYSGRKSALAAVPVLSSTASCSGNLGLQSSDPVLIAAANLQHHAFPAHPMLGRTVLLRTRQDSRGVNDVLGNRVAQLPAPVAVAQL